MLKSISEGPPVYLALFHTHVVNRQGIPVTTSVTNLDIHDIARSARTFGVEKYYILTPLYEQRAMVERILEYWRSDASRAHHPKRVEALSRVSCVESYQRIQQEIVEKTGHLPEVVLTDARKFPQSMSYSEYREWLTHSDRPQGQPVLLVFGTGWGISQDFYPEVNRILAPIYGPEGSQESGGYNHLSVRSAVAIILDRLFGN